MYRLLDLFVLLHGVGIVAICVIFALVFLCVLLFIRGLIALFKMFVLLVACVRFVLCLSDAFCSCCLMCLFYLLYVFYVLLLLQSSYMSLCVVLFRVDDLLIFVCNIVLCVPFVP